MAQFLAPVINDQQEDANGDPLSGGTIEVYQAGTSTPANTTSDKAGLVPNAWPIVLNVLGVNNQGSVWVTGGSAYKFVIKNSVGVVQRTIDNVSGINDNMITADQWVVYQATPTFVSATSFTVAGDQTQTFQVGRRIKTTNTGGAVYSTITGSVYSAPNTTITVRNDSGVLDSGLSAVSYGVISVSDTSLPGGLIPYGQCLLFKSGANLVLRPFNGNKITINGAICLIPSAGVSLAPGAVVPGTLYYIYAFMNAGVLTLEASTTTHATDGTTGLEIKSGDPTRTLVGMARPIAGPAWVDTALQRFVISWFNRKPLFMGAVIGANQGNSGTSFSVLLAGLLLEFLTWGDAVSARFQGGLTNNVANAVSITSIFVDGAASESYSASGAYTSAAAQPVYCSVDTVLSEGYHNFQVYALQTPASTATYTGAGSAGSRCVHSAMIQG